MKIILNIITGLKPGGAEKVVYDLSLYFSKSENYEIKVISLSKKDKLLESFLESGIDTEVLYLNKNPLGLIKSIKKVNKFIRENKVELIHAHMTHSLFFSLILKLLNKNLKIVFTPHNFNLGSSLRERFVKVTKRMRSGDILFSEKMKTNIYRNDSHIIPNGIDTKQYFDCKKKNKKFIIITIGRIEKVKNHIKIIDFAFELKKQVKNIEFQIIGEGVLLEEVKAYSAQKNVTDIVIFRGFRKDIAELCSKADLFILPSLWEGLPISLLEAGAAGLPILSTPVGSISDLINEKNGYLEEVDNFAETIKYIYENYQEAKSKALVLQEEIQNKYDLNIIGEKHAQLYGKLLDEKR